jgi:sugar/nucleoside kinase (ribokinase family)
MPPTGPVVCFSYLATAELWKVPCFPLANHGAEVLHIESSIAADGPMAAAVLSVLNVPTLLLSNNMGNDPAGSNVHTWLQRYGVNTTASVTSSRVTPQIVVVADDHGTRTWFPYLPGVAEDLTAVDLSPLVGASFAYIDCYQLIEAAAVRAIQVGRMTDVPLLLNLGGSPLSPLVATTVYGYPRLVVQTNVDDAAAATALHTATSILRATDAAWVVVTSGAAGALALSEHEQVASPAFQVAVRHTHCAGAAFSGGLLYGLLHDWPMDKALELACASGTMRCERGHHEPMPTFDELQTVIGSRQRLNASAA